MDLYSINGLSLPDIVNVLAIDIEVLKIRLLLLEKREKEEEKRRNRKKRVWMKTWIKRRPEHGAYDRLMEELRCEDEASFENFMRFPVVLFQEFVDIIGPKVQRKDTSYRPALPAALKIAVTLRYLATGNTYQDLHFHFRLGVNSICLAIPEVCQAILDEYADDYMTCPLEEEEWRRLAKDFENKWNLPHCCGSIDGKHVAMRKPGRTGSLYFNYKGFCSVVLMALVDAHYRFLYASCGDYGSISDGGVFERTDLKEALNNNSLNFPPPEPIVPGERPIPYYIVGDEAFPLKTWLMKPLPQRNMSTEQRIYNYRLSRA